MQKDITLNNEKRKIIADVFQQYFFQNSPLKKKHQEAIDNYNSMRTKAKEIAQRVVRQHQPQEDIETIRSMVKKYGDSGGRLYDDNCFYFTMPTVEVDDEGREQEHLKEIHVKFSLSENFAYSYFRDKIVAKGLDPDFRVKLRDDWSRRNPTYHSMEQQVDEFLGFRSSNNVSQNQDINIKENWNNDFELEVIGSSYCHSRQFKVDEDTFEFFRMYNVAQEKVETTHKELFEAVDDKMQKLRLGLKSYKYFSQAKKLADLRNIPLNESILNESSTMALSIYSPENLASLLEDKVELTREEKIAIARAQANEQLVSH